MTAGHSVNNAILKKEKDTLPFRNETFEIVFHYYIDNKTGHKFHDAEAEHLNITQVHNQYRSRHGIPFVDEIKNIREQYGLSASKMSEILGLGTNVYRNYELGEVPSPSVGRLIQLAKDPAKFGDLLALNRRTLNAAEMEKVLKKLEGKQEERDIDHDRINRLLRGNEGPSDFNGYRQADIGRIGQMASFFSIELQPNKTKLDKLFFLTDFIHYNRSGVGVSGIAYESIYQHPSPRYAGSMYDYLLHKSCIDVTMVEAGAFEIEQYTSHIEKPDVERFASSELKAMLDAISFSSRFNPGGFDEGKHRAPISYNRAFHMQLGA